MINVLRHEDMYQEPEAGTALSDWALGKLFSQDAVCACATRVLRPHVLAHDELRGLVVELGGDVLADVFHLGLTARANAQVLVDIQDDALALSVFRNLARLIPRAFRWRGLVASELFFELLLVDFDFRLAGEITEEIEGELAGRELLGGLAVVARVEIVQHAPQELTLLLAGFELRLEALQGIAKRLVFLLELLVSLHQIHHHSEE